MKKLLLLLGIISGSLSASAQLDVVDNQTAQSLAQTLTGQGVIVLNPVLNCTGTANGKFNVVTGGTTNLGIDSGIVLTSGRAMTTGGNMGVNGPNVGSGPSNSNGAPGDPDLNTVLPGTATFDRCVLEFDFTPSGDTIKFDYVFGSSEYQSFSCSSFNDVFGFFISGPGITGNQNIAKIPGTNIPICVNSTTGVNTGTLCTNMGPGSPFAMYYVANVGGASITYYGFTSVFTAIASVIPCDTYHLKLAIADGVDQILDSGVFLKAGSLNSTGIQLTPESTAGANTPTPHCIRGCRSGSIGVSRNAPRITPLTVKYLIEGTAINGVDYQMIPDSVVIPANQTDAEIVIKPLLVQYATGPREVIIKVLSPYNCGTTGLPMVVDTTSIWIYDSLFASIPTAPVTVCPRTEIAITADIDPSLNFSWSPAALIPDPLPLGLTIHPKPTVPTNYTVTVTQPNAPSTCQPVSRTYHANVEPIPQLKLPSHDTIICLADSIDLDVFAEPLGLAYGYSWSPASNLRNDFSPNNRFFGDVGDYKYVITATTPVANCPNKDSMYIHVVPPFEFESVTPKDTTIKYGDRIKLSSESEAIYWIWDPITFLDDPMARQPWASPLKDMNYQVIGINKYGCKDTADVHIKVVYDPKTGMPNAFSPNGDGLNDVFKIGNIQYEKMTLFRVYNRYGQCVYDGKDPAKGWDGTFNDKPAQSDVYYYHIKLTIPGGKQVEYKGDVTLLR